MSDTEIHRDFHFKQYVEIQSVDQYCDIGGYWHYDITENVYYLEVRNIYDIYNHRCVKHEIRPTELAYIENLAKVDMLKTLEAKLECYNLNPRREPV